MPRLTTTITICIVDCPETTEPAYRTVTFTLADYGTEATYAWDFGDGEDDETSTNEVTHVYAASGSYEVSVVVTTELGEQGSAIDCAVEVQDVYHTQRRSGSLKAKTASRRPGSMP